MASIKELKNKDKEIVYQITVTSGRDKNGKQIRHYMTYKPDLHTGITKHQLSILVNKTADEFEASVKSKNKFTSESLFRDFADYVMEIKKDSYKPRTLEKNIELLARINEAIGDKKLRLISVQDLNIFYSSLRKEGVNKRTGGRLSEKTILEHHRLTSMILNKAVQEKLISENVAPNAEIPKPIKPTVNYYTQKEFESILKCAKNESLRNQVLIFLLSTLGARIGEVLGLQFKDINMSTGEVEISKALLYNKANGLYISTTKTGKPRKNQLPDEVLAIITKYKTWYEEYKQAYIDWQGEKKLEDCYLFIQDNGKNMHTSTPRFILNKFSKTNNLPKLNPHAFRHTYASYLLEKSVSIVTVAKLLGHASIKTTLDYYSHVMSEDGQESKKEMNILFHDIQS